MPGALKAKVGGNWVLASSAAGGGGAEEVYVGPIDPGANYDLWIDTGTAQTLPQDARWNTSWGQVVASGGWVVGLGAAGNGVYTYVNPTSVIPTLMAGRQYVLSLTQNSSYGSGVGETWGWRPEIDAVPVGGEFYWQIAVAGAYLGPSTQDLPFTVATTGVKSLRVGVRRVNGSGTLQCRGSFVIYDTGPVTGALLSPEPTPIWNQLNYSTGWTNYAGGFLIGGYRKLGDMVQLRGLITQVAGATSSMFTLPVGYRPPGIVIQSCLCSTGQARYDIQSSNGNFVTSTTIAAGNWVCIDGIQFSVTA
jgi:hypothetical protein